MSPKIKVCLLGLICLIFSFYGHFVCERVISNFVKSDQCFRNVTYELSPLFDTHTITIVDSQVKAANGLISFDQLCKNMVLAEDNIKNHCGSVVKQAFSLEQHAKLGRRADFLQQRDDSDGIRSAYDRG